MAIYSRRKLTPLFYYFLKNPIHCIGFLCLYYGDSVSMLSSGFSCSSVSGIDSFSRFAVLRKNVNGISFSTTLPMSSSIEIVRIWSPSVSQVMFLSKLKGCSLMSPIYFPSRRYFALRTPRGALALMSVVMVGEVIVVLGVGNITSRLGISSSEYRSSSFAGGSSKLMSHSGSSAFFLSTQEIIASSQI